MLSGSSSTSMSEVTLEANVETPRGLIEPLGSGSGISNGREKVLEEAFLSIGERADDGTLSVEEMMSSGELKASIEVLQRKDKPKAEKVAVLRTLMAAFKDMTDSDIIVEQNVVEILCSEMRRLYTGKMNAEGNEGEVGSQGCSVGDTVPAVKANVNCFEFWATGALFISKTVNLSNEGRNRLLQCRGLDLLACAALRDEMVAVRTQACQAIATMGTWSGPQNAAEVLETPYVVKAIDTVLRDVKHEFSSALKCSMIDAVSVMASRNKARGILQRGGINDAVTVAVKSASNSKDLFFAAKASVAAGALRGKTVDKFGFVVEAKTSSMASEETEEDSPDMSVVLDDTKIQQSQQQQSQYENILRTQNTAHPEAITSPTVDLGNYLSLAKTTAAATRGLSFFGDDKESIAMWSALLENNEVDSLRRQSDGKLLKYLRELARGGIPQSLRWKVWPFLLCIDELKKEHEGLFKKSLEAPLSVATRNDIDKDVTRTMPSHELFWSGGAQVGLKSLRNVLRAYAAAVPEVGYCQGMSSICALFLVNASTEEDAFLMFMAFMEQYQYKGMFEPGLPFLFVMLDQLDYTINKFFPSVAQKFEHEGVPTETFASKWFMTGFTYCFPPILTFRIWDIVLVEGNTKMFIRAALAVISLSKERMEDWNMEEMILWLQNDFALKGTGVLDDVEKVLDIACQFKFSRLSVDRYVKTKPRRPVTPMSPKWTNPQTEAQNEPPPRRRLLLRCLKTPFRALSCICGTAEQAP